MFNFLCARRLCGIFHTFRVRWPKNYQHVELERYQFVAFAGMDPKNERMIFSQVVGAAAQADSPQYFLVTPKLLPGLNYSNVNVLLVYNGPWQIAQVFIVVGSLHLC